MDTPLVDLNTLIPTIKTVTVKKDQEGAEAIKITPFRFSQFAEVSKYIVLIRANTDESGDLDMLKLVADHGKEIGDIIRVATGKPTEWVGDLELTDALELAVAILEVNRDFFSQRLVPRLRELAAKLSSGGK